MPTCTLSTRGVCPLRFAAVIVILSKTPGSPFLSAQKKTLKSPFNYLFSTRTIYRLCKDGRSRRARRLISHGLARDASQRPCTSYRTGYSTRKYIGDTYGRCHWIEPALPVPGLSYPRRYPFPLFSLSSIRGSG